MLTKKQRQIIVFKLKILCHLQFVVPASLLYMNRCVDKKFITVINQIYRLQGKIMEVT